MRGRLVLLVIPVEGWEGIGKLTEHVDGNVVDIRGVGVDELG